MYLGLFIILFFTEELLAVTPDWVLGLRSGEERFKLTNGSSTIFRQIAQTCEEAIYQVEQDMEREYNMSVKYTKELVYQDEKGCAITATVGAKIESRTPNIQDLMLKQTKIAVDNAITGISYETFKERTKDPSPIVYVPNVNSYCYRHAGTFQESNHGFMTICWKESTIQMFCMPELKKCYKKTKP